jgi:hypothetical protein
MMFSGGPLMGNAAERPHQDNDSNFNGEHVREGLSCIVAVKVPNPEFEGQTKTRLGNPEVRKAVDMVVAEELTEALGFRLDVLGSIVKKAAAAARVRTLPLCPIPRLPLPPYDDRCLFPAGCIGHTYASVATNEPAASEGSSIVRSSSACGGRTSTPPVSVLSPLS